MEDDLRQYEEDLVRRAADDPAAFRQLYEHYFRRVYGYVASRISHPDDAEDAVSEVFLRVVRHLPRLRGQHPASFAAWLFTIARNTVTDYYRRQASSERAVALEAAPPAAALVRDPAALLIDGEDRRRLREMIAALPERKREVIMLKYYAGLRNQEIAAVLQIRERTVAAYLSRALEELYEKYTCQEAEQKEVADHDS